MTDPISGDTLSTPDPTTQTLILTLLRAVVQILGAVGITLPAWTNSGALPAIAGALAVIGTLVWSVWQKYTAAKVAHAGAVASAQTGVALKGTGS